MRRLSPRDKPKPYADPKPDSDQQDEHPEQERGLADRKPIDLDLFHPEPHAVRLLRARVELDELAAHSPAKIICLLALHSGHRPGRSKIAENVLAQIAKSTARVRCRRYQRSYESFSVAPSVSEA